MKHWPTGSKAKVLEEQFPGCKTAFDAVRSILGKNKIIDHQDRIAAQVMEMTPAEKFKQVSAEIGKRLKAGDESKIPPETWTRLAAMPLETVEQVRAWGFAWLEEIKKLSVP